MKHFRLGSFQIKQLMSSCIQQKLLLNLLLTEAKTKTLAQKLKTQQNLHSFVRCKLRNLSRRRFNLIFKKNTYTRLRELHNDGQNVDENAGPTVVQKGTHLELILNYNLCTVVSGKKYSLHLPKCMSYGRQHYGFQSSGLNNIHLNAGERLEDLLYFDEDNLLTSDGHISYHDIIPEANMRIFLMHLRIL